MKRILTFSLVTAALAASALTSAQPTGYAGPSSKATAKSNDIPTSVPLMTAKQLLDNGKNDQYVRLRGKLVNHKGGEDYEFVDASGKITVEIDDDRFPAGVRIDQNTTVELTGEFDKNMLRDSTFEVEQIKIVTK